MKRVNALTNKPIWCTELGWSSSEHEWGVTEREQAVFGIKEYVISQAKDLCDRIYWYDIQNDGTDVKDIESNFGLIEATTAEDPNVAKPSYVAFAALNKLLGNAEYKECIENDNIRAYRFTDAYGEDILVLWSEQADVVTLDLGTDSIEIMDIYSNVTDRVKRGRGIYTIPLDDEITYVRGNFKNFSETTDTNFRYCNVSYKNGNVYVEGESQTSGEEITVYIYSDTNKHIYSNQVTSDENSKFTFNADISGEGEVYICVNYGEMYQGTLPNALIKLMCNGKEIKAVKQIEGNSVELVISVKKPFDTDVDFFAAAYNQNRLLGALKQEILSGKTGEWSIKISIDENMKPDSITGFLWTKNMVPIDKKDF